MNVIVFDLEWNQPADGKNSAQRELLFEIIEIGAVKLDQAGNIISKFSELIKPRVYRKLNWHIQKMLNLNIHDLDKGAPFPEVMERFINWCGEDMIFCTWGTQDITELERNIDYYKMDPISLKPIKYYNAQKMFGKLMKEEDNSRSLESAIDMLQIEKDIPFHRALSDAYYTAKIFSCFDKNLKKFYSYDLYHLPESNKDEIYMDYDKEHYFVSKGYATREEMAVVRRNLAMTCKYCKRSIRPKVRWFSTNAKVYYGGAICVVHGPIKGKLKIKKNQDGLYYIEKLLSYCSTKELMAIKDKKSSIKNKATVKDEEIKKEIDSSKSQFDKVVKESSKRK